MKYKVMAYKSSVGIHRCEDKHRRSVNIDLLANNILPEEYQRHPELLVGRHIEIEEITAWEVIADDILVLED